MIARRRLGNVAIDAGGVVFQPPETCSCSTSDCPCQRPEVIPGPRPAVCTMEARPGFHRGPRCEWLADLDVSATLIRYPSVFPAWVVPTVFVIALLVLLKGAR